MSPSSSPPNAGPGAEASAAEQESVSVPETPPELVPEEGQPAPPPPPPARRRGRPLLWVILLAMLAVAGWGALDFDRFLHQPLSQAVVLEIERGWPLARIADTLEQQGVVRSAYWFMLLARVSRLRISAEGIKQGPGIQAGEYAFPVGETPDLVLNRLITGNQLIHRLVIPEGMTMAEIGAKMQSLGWEDAGALLSEPATGKKLGLEGVEGQTLEGWLFPSTYHYLRRDSATELLARMVKQSRQVLNEQWKKANQAEGAPPSRAVPLSPFEALILASIIEKETGQAEERPRISAVFHNRLRLKMRLQSDPTVIYGLQRSVGGPGFDGNLTRQHLKTPTPYNTYTQLGLPPTPICNPGTASIQAALHPADVEDLFFVARGEGFHVFSKTLKEHEANVDRYQRHPAKKQ
ncbi:MAG: endolytic transglycosylase MltG [Magnetococcales bacterium]|nr:endolytic transglycosylase MltG [Magnetococcales bacterium]